MKSLYVNYTPLPREVPRQLAIEILHSHGEIITLNPLVLDYKPIKAPADAPNDEYYATWYEITQRVKIMPGMGRWGSSKITFKGVFHDMPWGIQTHTYIPLGVSLKHKWQVRGNQPGEPPEAREMGSKAPGSGLYLEENVEIECNALALSFVKKELKEASKVMIERMMRKAELLDAGVLQAMFLDGKLKTINPADKSNPHLNGDNNTQAPDSGVGRWRPPANSVSSDMRPAPSPMPSFHESRYNESRYSESQYTTSSTSPEISNPAGSGFAVEMLGDTHFSPELAANPARGARKDSEWSEPHGDTWSSNASQASAPSSSMRAAKPMPQMAPPSYDSSRYGY